jgi:hypothetical protein
MNGIATFSVNPPPPQGVTGIYVQGAANSGAGTFTASSGAIQANAATFAVFAQDQTNLPFQTQFYNPLQINWSVAQANSCNGSGATCASAGTSYNPVYVTLAQNILPLGKTIMLTYVSLAVGNGGATTQAEAFANTWAQVSTGSGPTNVWTWDQQYLSYYPLGVGFQLCATDPILLITTDNANGQCGSFAQLLMYALDMNGVGSSFATVKATDKTLMVIDNWSWPPSPTQPSTLPYG